MPQVVCHGLAPREKCERGIVAHRSDRFRAARRHHGDDVFFVLAGKGESAQIVRRYLRGVRFARVLGVRTIDTPDADAIAKVSACAANFSEARGPDDVARLKVDDEAFSRA